MPEIGETKKARELGYKGAGHLIYMWHACEYCGHEKWRRTKFGKPMHTMCNQCIPVHLGQTSRTTPRKAPLEKRILYKFAHLDRDDFFFPMAYKGSRKVPLHRLIMAKHKQRCLLPWEVVHHRNGDKRDNRIENLSLLGGRDKHNILINKELWRLRRQVAQLQKRMTQLEAEAVLLRNGAVPICEQHTVNSGGHP